MAEEVVELRGHLIDSLILPKGVLIGRIARLMKGERATRPSSATRSGESLSVAPPVDRRGTRGATPKFLLGRAPRPEG